MAEFTVNSTRFDPYKNFKFRVKWDGKYVAGVSYVDPSTSRKSPGLTSYEPITLARGVSHDTAFEDWANLVWRLGAGMGTEVGLQDFRKDIVIEFYNEAGQLALAYKVYRCWVSEYQALPALDANTSEVAIQSIRLENEGWERDLSVPEPTEPK